MKDNDTKKNTNNKNERDNEWIKQSRKTNKKQRNRQ